MENKKNNLSFTIILFFVSAAFFAFSQIFMHATSSAPWDKSLFDIFSVNILDRSLARPYHHLLHKISDLTCALDLVVLPLAILIFSTVKSKRKTFTFFTLLLVYATCIFFSKGIYDFIKSTVERIRPYMYFENPSPKGILNGDFQHSFPSGHTCNACLGAAFFTATLVFYKKNLSLKKQSHLVSFLIALAYLIAAVTGALRIISGNHFFTDVIVGALLGSFEGYAVTLLNQKFLFKDSL